MKELKVYWAPWCDFKNGQMLVEDSQILFSEPEPLYKNLRANRTTDHPKSYFRCPSFIEMCKNNYVVKAPYDLQLDYNRSTDYFVINQDQEVCDAYAVNRFDTIGKTDPRLISLPPKYIFYSEDDITIEVLPCFLQNEKIKWDVLPGTFNIKKWMRPVEFCCELHNGVNRLDIKRDDPLFQIRFITPNNQKIVFERVNMTLDLFQTSIACVGAKKRQSFMPLKQVYEMAEGLLKTFKKKQ